jgi:hypothetical protein
MWLSNRRNNFAPFAGFMLMGYEKTGGIERAEESGEPVEDMQGGGDATDNEVDNVPA